MQTALSNSVVVVSGFLQADGTIRLDHPLGLQPGPIEMAIRPIASRTERLPDLAVDELCESPPFELPRLGDIRAVHPLRVLYRLPAPVQSVEGA